MQSDLLLIFHVAAAVLASWRLVELFLVDRITSTLRTKYSWYVLKCSRCLSVWTAIIATVLFLVCPWMNWPFAIAWLYLWHGDAAYTRRVQREGRKIVISVNGANAASISKSDFAGAEMVSVLAQTLSAAYAAGHPTDQPKEVAA